MNFIDFIFQCPRRFSRNVDLISFIPFHATNCFDCALLNWAVDLIRILEEVNPAVLLFCEIFILRIWYCLCHHWIAWSIRNRTQALASLCYTQAISCYGLKTIWALKTYLFSKTLNWINWWLKVPRWEYLLRQMHSRVIIDTSFIFEFTLLHRTTIFIWILKETLDSKADIYLVFLIFVLINLIFNRKGSRAESRYTLWYLSYFKVVLCDLCVFGSADYADCCFVAQNFICFCFDLIWSSCLHFEILTIIFLCTASFHEFAFIKWAILFIGVCKEGIPAADTQIDWVLNFILKLVIYNLALLLSQRNCAVSGLWNLNIIILPFSLFILANYTYLLRITVFDICLCLNLKKWLLLHNWNLWIYNI